jgi:protocatechuate 3,4-dioxygenase beta subunit
MKIALKAALSWPGVPRDFLIVMMLFNVTKTSCAEDVSQTPVPGLQICGVVRDASGAAVPDVLVTFYPAWHPNMFLRAKTRTDRNGRYNFALQCAPDKAFWVGSRSRMSAVMARCPERNLAAIAEFEPIPTNLDLNLQPGITLSGLVMDTNTVPIPGAAFKLVFVCDKLSFELDENPVNADAVGRFVIPGLPQGRDYMSFPRITAEGYGAASLHLDATHSCTNQYEFPPMVLKRANCMLAGLVLGDDGKPVPGASVNLFGRDQRDLVQTKTDGSGHFLFRAICPGEVWLNGSFFCPDYSVMSSGPTENTAEAGTTNVVLILRHQAADRGVAH